MAKRELTINFIDKNVFAFFTCVFELVYSNEGWDINLYHNATKTNLLPSIISIITQRNSDDHCLLWTFTITLPTIFRFLLSKIFFYCSLSFTYILYSLYNMHVFFTKHYSCNICGHSAHALPLTSFGRQSLMIVDWCLGMQPWCVCFWNKFTASM